MGSSMGMGVPLLGVPGISRDWLWWAPLATAPRPGWPMAVFKIHAYIWWQVKKWGWTLVGVSKGTGIWIVFRICPVDLGCFVLRCGCVFSHDTVNLAKRKTPCWFQGRVSQKKKHLSDGSLFEGPEGPRRSQEKPCILSYPTDSFTCIFWLMVDLSPELKKSNQVEWPIMENIKSVPSPLLKWTWCIIFGWHSYEWKLEVMPWNIWRIYHRTIPLMWPGAEVKSKM